MVTSKELQPCATAEGGLCQTWVCLNGDSHFRRSLAPNRDNLTKQMASKNHLRQQEKNRIRSEFLRSKKKKKKGRKKPITYKEYLKSKKWFRKKQELFLLRGKKCERCPNVSRLQVHHKTYERLFNEKLSDLEILCSSCHKKEHGIGVKKQGSRRNPANH